MPNSIQNVVHELSCWNCARVAMFSLEHFRCIFVCFFKFWANGERKVRKWNGGGFIVHIQHFTSTYDTVVFWTLTDLVRANSISSILYSLHARCRIILFTLTTLISMLNKRFYFWFSLCESCSWWTQDNDLQYKHTHWREPIHRLTTPAPRTKSQENKQQADNKLYITLDEREKVCIHCVYACACVYVCDWMEP